MKILNSVLNNVFVKWIILPGFLLAFWLVASILFNPYAPFTVIVYKHPSANFSEYHQGVLLKGQQIRGVFTAQEDNLGIIGVQIRGGVSSDPDNQESLRFRLKEYKSSKIIYENSYTVGRIREKGYLTFGFPKIANSKNKSYEFTVTSLNGNSENGLDLHKEADFFITKYINSGKSLKSIKVISSLIEQRLRMLFLNSEALLVSTIYFLPFLFYITITGFTQTFKSRLGSLTLSSVFLSIIFISDIYAGITLGLLGLWIIAIAKDKVQYKYSLAAALFFFSLAGLLSIFPFTVQVNSSSMWGYLLLMVGLIQIIVLGIKHQEKYAK